MHCRLGGREDQLVSEARPDPRNVARSSKRRARQPTLMGSHQRCWIWGRMAVTETLAAARWPPLELHLDQSLSPHELKTAIARAKKLAVPVTLDSAVALSRLCR